MFSKLRETIGGKYQARQSPSDDDVNLKTKAKKWERHPKSMLAVGEKGTWRPR